MDRTSINLRSTAKLSKWLSADVKVNYVSQHTNNRVKLAGDPDNIFLNYLSMPRSVGFSDYDAYKDNDWKRADGKPAGYLIDTGANANNPIGPLTAIRTRIRKTVLSDSRPWISRLRIG